MSSQILYKFRSGTTFEALPLPGSSARLLDIKKAIVTAKKLDQGSMDFDLSVKDANSGVEYKDESALLPRGTRLVVHRLPAQRGQGILAKIARSQQYGGGYGNAAAEPLQQHTPSDFYTIDSRAHDEDEEFISSAPPPPTVPDVNKDEQELARIQAFIETEAAVRTVPSSSRATMMRGGRGGGGPAGSGPPPRAPAGGNFHEQQRHHQPRPNADPELREQEVQLKKRPTGIPRTFQSLTAPLNAASDGGSGVAIPQIQPNTIGFDQLVQRGGGQSENASGTKRDLDYAIKVTGTTVPEYLQCAICHGVVRDAMMLPWDTEGRTVCERCIRDALSQNGFCCPLTHKEGCSPDDLLPNYALRKAADQFIQDVMKKIQEIEDQAKLEEDILVPEMGGVGKVKVLEGDMADGGVLLTRRASAADQKRKKEEEDPFGGGDDDFGGDIFAVAEEERDNEAVTAGDEDANSVAIESKQAPGVKKEEDLLEPSQTPMVSVGFSDRGAVVKVEPTMERNLKVEISSDSPTVDGSASISSAPVKHWSSGPPSHQHINDGQRYESSSNHGSAPSHKISGNDPLATNRRSRLPAGYSMGPASVVVESATVTDAGNSTNAIERAPSAHSPRDAATVDQSSLDRAYRGGRYLGGRGGSVGYVSPRYDSAQRSGGRGAHQDLHRVQRNEVSFLMRWLLC